MKQVQQAHPVGFFARCADCAREPRHYLITGTSSREPPALMFAPRPPRHMLECNCGHRTAMHANPMLAESEWKARFAQRALPPASVVSILSNRK